MLHREERNGTEILAVSVDSHAESKKLLAALQERFAGDYQFSLLEDKDHRVIDRYGLLHPDGRGWPHPTTYVIDRKGIIRWRFVEVDYTKRPSNADIAAELKKLR